MNTALSLTICAALFALFGLVMRRQRRGAGCSSCTSACPSKESRHG